MFKNWKAMAEKFEIETYALYLAYKDPRVPLRIKVVILLVIAYLLSPIDLIPDFIPVIGYLDDFLLITVGIPILLKMVPKEIMNEHRESAKTKFSEGMPKSRFVALIIVLIWVLAAFIVLNFVVKFI
ncbi:YkvA family protein [Methanobacterium sp. MBAC-LM]|uniref:YkvA family protein n=1 Tax=Methanobacterium sp. MBAC-LM TaxID=3412034 RepID=UPI003C78991A